MMFNKDIPKEYANSVNTVVNYVLKHYKDELSLSKLAGIANYSPFHFQKIFKQLTGESPKQFIIRIRLENAAHFLITHQHKSVTEIALDSGFASPATFSRAFRNYFGISADELRKLSPKERIAIRKTVISGKNSEWQHFAKEYKENQQRKKLNITVNKISSFQILFINAPLSEINKIQDAFKRVIQLADAYDLLTRDSKFIGIINPHAGLYQAAVTYQLHQSAPKDVATTEIDGGKFITCKIKGDIIQIFHTFHSINEVWLPQSSFRIKQSYAFEILSQNPLTKPYPEIKREIYIPIEPA
jgi:AraC family transcriptional regulator